jgi:hypothetical protein
LGSEQFAKKQHRKLGKVDALLNEKLKKVEWGEFKLGDLFEIFSSKNIYHANEIDNIYNNQVTNSLPYVVRTTQNNGIRGYIIEDIIYANDENTLSFAQDTFSVFYQKQKYFTGNKVKVLKAKFEKQNERVMQYITASFQKSLDTFTWGTGSTVETISLTKIQLPTRNGKIDFEFMENFIADLEAERISKLANYLEVTGLKDYTLTAEEEKVLADFENGKVVWGEFNLESLFGKSTRGRRLKSDDRTLGTLPFVTAGETDEGVSAFIGNNVTVFSENTTTIDMFGSAKYRNYKYGGDDHIAVVHTQNLPKLASVFVTTSIHKTSYNGQFNYGRNFYAKDADVLNISLPVKENKPDYELMETFISAIQKLVIKDVVMYADKKITATKSVVNNK